MLNESEGSYINCNICCLDFAKLFPYTLSEEVFRYLDVCNICSASQVSKTWNEIINESNYIWKHLYDTIPGRSNVILSSKKISMKWRVLVAQQYINIKRKQKWIEGQFSSITSFKQLENAYTVCEFSRDDWGDILQKELERGK